MKIKQLVREMLEERELLLSTVDPLLPTPKVVRARIAELERRLVAASQAGLYLPHLGGGQRL